MTIFGKLIMGVVLLLIGTGVFYGVTSYVKEDSVVIATQETSTTEVSTTTDEALLVTATTSTTTEQKPEKNGKKIPFSDFISKGGVYKCTVTQTIADMTSDGVVYFHNSLVRAEFSNTIAGQSISTTMIARDGYTYSWSNITADKGYKSKITSSTGDTSKIYVWDGAQIGDYSCAPWVADDKVFEIPKSVTFTLQ